MRQTLTETWNKLTDVPEPESLKLARMDCILGPVIEAHLIDSVAQGVSWAFDQYRNKFGSCAGPNIQQIPYTPVMAKGGVVRVRPTEEPDPREQVLPVYGQEFTLSSKEVERLKQTNLDMHGHIKTKNNGNDVWIPYPTIKVVNHMPDSMLYTR